MPRAVARELSNTAAVYSLLVHRKSVRWLVWAWQQAEGDPTLPLSAAVMWLKTVDKVELSAPRSTACALQVPYDEEYRVDCCVHRCFCAVHRVSWLPHLVFPYTPRVLERVKLLR